MAEPDVLCTKVAGTCVKDAPAPVVKAGRPPELPTWFVMESMTNQVGNSGGLPPRHPLSDDRDLGEQEDVTYAITCVCPLESS